MTFAVEERRHAAGLLDRGPAPRRYERPVPGDLLHLDTKKLGRLLPGGGKRVWALKRTGPGGAGWEYVHVAVDDRSRVAYVERLASDDARSCALFLERALAYFSDLGMRVRQVMTDNARSSRNGRDFAQILRRQRIEHIRIPPYTPRWNGKAEAFIGILLKEWAYARPYVDNRARAIALPAFVHTYTHRRPHGDLGGLTPIQRLVNDLSGHLT